ncbi:MAG: GAF domain-containing sensor histidine kinase [Anaerolineae bacterium]|nr:GAF domain-containing sensor histidine kinase [Anaerolineae bacterium]
MTKPFRKSESPYLADWFAVTFRWLNLLGCVASLGLAESYSVVAVIMLAQAVMWNMAVSLMAIFNRRIFAHRPINLGVDILISLLLFVVTGGLEGPLVWVGLLALVTAAIYYEWRGVLPTALGMAALQVGLVYLMSDGQPPLQGVITLAAGTLAAGVLLAFLSTLLMNWLRATYLTQVRQRKEREQKVQALERDRLGAFSRMVESLSATLDYTVVLDTIMDMSAGALGMEDAGANQLVRAVLLFGEHDLSVATARRFPPPDLRVSFPAEKGALADVIKSGEMQRVDDPAEDPELSRLVVMQSCRTAVCLPLMRGLNAYGVLLYGHPDPDFFSSERLDLMQMLNNQAVIAIQNARLFHDLAQEKERIIETQEEARKKLARDLHDGPTQTVAAIAMRLNMIRILQDENPARVAAELETVEEMALRTSQEIRHMLFTLRPLVLETEGLEAALNAMAGKMRDTYQQNVSVSVSPQVVDELDLGKQTVIFYLAEEAVNNARKHAQAGSIQIRLRFWHKDEEIALLEVIDDGVGFDVQAVSREYEQRGSLGMVNLRERADLISGVLHIDSAPGKGTRVMVIIPLTESATDRLQRANNKTKG